MTGAERAIAGCLALVTWGALVVGAWLGVAWLVMLAWNAAAVALFGAPHASYPEAVALLFLLSLATDLLGRTLGLRGRRSR